MKLSDIVLIIEAVSVYPLVGIRQDDRYIMVDIGFVSDLGHAGPTVPFVMHQLQLQDAVNGPEYVKILTQEACEKLRKFLPQVAVHP